jgi:hypothetical protein
MTQKSVADMALSIRATLEKNGFPANRVSLPLERLYEAAHKDGLNFNKVLDELHSSGIAHEKTPDKIIFMAVNKDDENTSGVFDQWKDLDFSKMNIAEMMSQASTLMSQMTPEQIQNVRKMYENLSPEERAKILEMAKSYNQ